MSLLHIAYTIQKEFTLKIYDRLRKITYQYINTTVSLTDPNIVRSFSILSIEQFCTYFLKNISGTCITVLIA